MLGRRVLQGCLRTDFNTSSLLACFACMATYCGADAKQFQDTLARLEMVFTNHAMLEEEMKHVKEYLESGLSMGMTTASATDSVTASVRCCSASS